MKPVTIQITGHTRQSAPEVCAALLDTERWPEFEGYSILPGIESAEFELKTPGWVGSRIRVRNRDGSSHVEEIIEWDETRRVALKFHDFSPPLQNFASHFVETWEFSQSANGTDLTRAMTMYPKGLPGWLVLLPISQLMKQAFKKQAEQSA